MVFVKGNKLGEKSRGVPKAKTEQWNNIVGWLVGDGGSSFKDKIKALSEGKEMTKEEKEFIQHYKDLLEFHQPKLSRVENNGSLNIKIEKIEQLESSLRFIAGVGNTGGGSDEDEGTGKESVQG